MAEDVIKQQIRCLIANVYDLQKLRIGAGNRLVQSFYLRMGIKPSEKIDSAEKEETQLIKLLRMEYERITDGVAEEGGSIRRRIKELSEKNDDPLKYIRDEMDYKLMESYVMLLKSEENMTKVLDKYVRQHPMWDKFFANIKGCGTLMSAVCIAYIDIHNSKYVSSLYRYCGLDTVQDTDKEGNKLFLKKVNGTVLPTKVREKYYYVDDNGETVDEPVKSTDEFDAEGNEIFVSESGLNCTKQMMWRNIEGEDVQVYEEVETGVEYCGDVVASEHGRRKGDTEMFKYIDKDGNEAMKRGITYNPVLKTKLMGVLTGCLIKAKDPVYSKIYYDYKERLNRSLVHKDYTPARKNMMAQRYMIKQFLKNMYSVWRPLEGLTVFEPYDVGVLGNKPHHCDGNM